MNGQRSIAYWRRMLFFMGLFRIPMILFVRPKLISIDEQAVFLKIKLRRRTRNHLGSMYFGSLAVGADTAAGLHAFYFSDQLGLRPSFAFKSMNAQFHSRATEDVIFSCTEGRQIRQVVEEASRTGERINKEVSVEARTVSGELAATFTMEISVKFKSKVAG